MPVAPILAADPASWMSAALCALIPAVPILVVLVIWRFFRSAVRSGVSQAVQSVPTPPAVVHAGMTEAQVREIVRDELRRISAERAARAAAAPKKA